jgi:hypothetical protein
MRIKIPKKTPAEPDVESICSIRWQFILSAIIWCKRADKKKLDKYKAIGSVVAVLGGIVIFMVLFRENLITKLQALDSCLCHR